MTAFEVQVTESGGKILDMEVVVDGDPMAALFGMDGRIEEWTVQKADGTIEKVRIASLQRKGTSYVE